MIRAIEAQPPIWPPGSTHSYHAMTYGWLIGEVIRRITGTLPGAYFREAVADPLALHTWIGLPAAARASVAWMEPPLPDEDSPAVRAIAASLAKPIAARSHDMGGAFAFPVQDGVVTFNDPLIPGRRDPGRQRHQHRACPSPACTPVASRRSTARGS